MKITYRKVNDHAWVNNTWLAPYCGQVVKLIEYKSGIMHLEIDGGRIDNVHGTYTASNGLSYTTKKLLGRPLSKPTNQ